MQQVNCIWKLNIGVVMVSTGIMKLEKLSEGDRVKSQN